MKVEVDFEDLERIIYATAIIKMIESALQSRKQDPFVQPHLNYTEAHNNLVEAMNHAKRADAGTKTEWDGALTDKEIKLLKQFKAHGVFEVTGTFRFKNEHVDTLAAKGCIRIGTMVKGAVWPGQERPDIKATENFALAITRRGQDKLEKLAHAGK